MERVYTIDEITGAIISMDTPGIQYCLIDYIEENFVYGYTITLTTVVKVYINGLWIDTPIPVNRMLDHLVYHKGFGCYILDYNVPLKQLIAARYVKESGYPYLFAKKYEAIEHFELFKGKQKILENNEFPIAKYFKYTFGLEYETCTGIIPEDICFRDGLIPLRDGSITGNEYSTVVLSGNEGFNLMYQQIKTLRKYTRFDKECSLHIHMGGFPLEPNKILSLYNLCYALQNELKTALPQYTFYTSKYKASGKDYCKLLSTSFNTFDEYYYNFTGTKFYGDLQQAHPNDVERSRKWQIHERYFWANLLNLICYRVNKTMEFRMLRPTYNLEKILSWMYIFNAIMQYAEGVEIQKCTKITLEQILKEIYPNELVKEVMTNFYKCSICASEQSKYGDYIGSRIDIEEEFFDKDKII